MKEKIAIVKGFLFQKEIKCTSIAVTVIGTTIYKENFGCTEEVIAFIPAKYMVVLEDI